MEIAVTLLGIAVLTMSIALYLTTKRLNDELDDLIVKYAVLYKQNEALKKELGKLSTSHRTSKSSIDALTTGLGNTFNALYDVRKAQSLQKKYNEDFVRTIRRVYQARNDK